MRLNEYVWSRNPRGMHNKNAPIKMNLDNLRATRMGWAKYAALDFEYVPDIQQLLASNITPIVRIWRPRFGAGIPDGKMNEAYSAYIREGAKWLEFYNEPNLENEWPYEQFPDYRNIAGSIAPLMENWLNWSEWVINQGAYPAFPALSEAVGESYDVLGWLNAMLTFLADRHYDRFRTIAQNGLWVATHPYIYNHFYQEGSGPLNPRSHLDYRADQGGWRFEYPYDPISQSDKPGLTTISGPGGSPGDPIGLIGMGDAFMRKFQELFGGGAIPVVGTEGGVFPVPTLSEFYQLDSRYPGYDGGSHAEATVAMFNWIVQQAPPWMFGVALWKENDYWETASGEVPAVQKMMQMGQPLKDVPPLEPLDGPGPRFLADWRGPGPIHGSPDYHFVVVAPGFNADWLFERGSAYFERFKPQLLPSIDYIGYLNYKRSLGVTVLATPNLAQYMRDEISGRWPAVWVDMLAVESAEALAKALDERVQTGRRFG